MATKSLGQLTLDLVARIGGFEKPLDQAARTSKRRMREIEQNGRDAAAGIATVVTAAAAAGAGVLAYSNIAAQSAIELKSQAQIANTTVEEMQRLAYASGTVGVEQEKLSNILKDVNDRVGDFINTGGGEMKDFFEQIAPQVGVTAEQFRNLSGPQALQLYFDSLQKANLSQSEMTFYMEAISDEATALIPLLRDGGKGFAEMGAEADALGIVLSDVETESLIGLAHDIDRVTGVMKGAADVAVAELAPAMSGLTDAIIETAEAWRSGDYDNQIEILTATASAATGAATAYGAYRAAVAAATVAQWAFQKAARANALGALISLVGAAVGTLYTYREELGLVEDKVGDVREEIDLLTGSVEDLTAAQLENKKVPLVAQMVEAQAEAQRLQAEIDKIADKARLESIRFQGRPGAATAQLEGLNGDDGLSAQLEEQQAVIQATEAELSDLDKMIAEMGESSSRASSQVKQNSSSAQDLEEDYQSLLDRLYPVVASQREFREEMELLDAAAAAGKIDDLAEAQQRLRDSYRSEEDPADVYGFMQPDVTGEGKGEEESYWQKWLEGAQVAMSDFDELAANTAENFSSRFGDAFEAMIFDAQSLEEAVYGLADSMARSIVNALGEMAAQWLAYQAVQLLVGETTQASAAATQTANAMAMSQMAALNAYASTAAIPVVGPAAAPAAAATALAATAPFAATVSSLSMAGMAHEGIDSIPATGTWLLEKGERVTTAETSAKLDRTLDQVARDQGSGGGGLTIQAPVYVQAQPGMSDREARRQGTKAGEAFRAEVLKVIQNEKRPGGALY